MKKQKSLLTMIALALAGTIVWAAPTLAQGRGQGQQCQGGVCRQGQGQVQGQGKANCPNYQSRNCPRSGDAASQGKAGRRGRGQGRNQQSNPRPSVPPATQ